MALTDIKNPNMGKGNEAKKEAKRLASKKCVEKKKARAEEKRKLAVEFIDELKKAGLYDKLSQKSKDFVVSLTAEKTTRASGNSILNVLFGNEPKVGQKVTLKEAFDKTLKGKATLDIMARRWKEKGIVIEYNEDPKEQIKSTYEIKALPKA